MADKECKHIHFTGIGGAGMAPLAHLVLAAGGEVSGSDLEFNSKCAALAAAGAMVFTGHRKENLPETPVDALVYTSAAKQENPELAAARERNIPCFRRGGFLAYFVRDYRRVAAVSGSHGKSSITAFLSKLLLDCQLEPGFMIGAEAGGMPSWACGENKDIFVTEADESDGTHTELHPYLGIIPNVEDDHAWSVGGKEQLENNFRTFAANCRKLLYVASETTDRLFADHPDAVRLSDIPENFAGLYGFQAVNAYIAYRSALILGADEAMAKRFAAEPPQVKRRMNIHFSGENVTVIEDYAHHPTEVRHAVEFLRKSYPEHHLRILFQPHRYARLERYFTEFAAELSKADSLFVTPVFAAWSESGSVDARQLAARANGREVSGDWQACAAEVFTGVPEKCVIAVLGAGDVNCTLPYLTALAAEAERSTK